MQTIRERWLILFGMLFLFAAGNFYANQFDIDRQLFTYCFLIAGGIGYHIVNRLGWVSQFYHVDRSLDPKVRAADESALWRGRFLFLSLAIYYVVYVYLTGGARSPLFSILYLPLVLAGLRYGTLTGLCLSGGFAVIETLANAMSSAPVATLAVREIGFPAAALFGSVLNTRLQLGFQSISERLAELDALLDVSRMLETAIDLQTTVNLLLINAQRIVAADTCAIYVLDHDNVTLRLSASAGSGASDFESRITIDAFEIDYWKVTSGKILLREQPLTDGHELSTINWPGSQSSQAIFGSLQGSEGVIGLLYLGRDARTVPFTEEEIAAIKRFAAHVGMPLQKARYQESLSILAFRDQMTDLSNHRYFEQRLSDDLLRAKRYQQQVSVIIMDIDHFKMFNDSYGHKAGDAVLKRFGQILKSCLRDSDLPARYGGEEFIVICPGTSNVEAMTVAERIRTSVEASDFDLGESLLGVETTTRITVSVGIASYPEHALSPNDLVRQADRSLYLAKKRGRNMTVSCSEFPPVGKTPAQA